jgi:hypothetical protein
LVGGNKGGVGKSLFCRALVEFGLTRNLAFVLAECDRETPDVARTYRSSVETIFAYFTEDPTKRSKADRLFSSAIALPVIANLPANVHEALRAWFIEDGLYELGQEHGVSFCHWYVTNGGYDSIKFFVKTLRDLGEWMPHILVRNWGLCDDWTHVDEDEDVQAAISQYRVPVIDLPKFPYAERNFVEAHQLTLKAAIQHPDLSLVSRQRIKNFMKEAFAQIAQTGVFIDAQSDSEKRS